MPGLSCVAGLSGLAGSPIGMPPISPIAKDVVTAEHHELRLDLEVRRHRLHRPHLVDQVIRTLDLGSARHVADVSVREAVRLELVPPRAVHEVRAVDVLRGEVPAHHRAGLPGLLALHLLAFDCRGFGRSRRCARAGPHRATGLSL